MPPRDMLHRVSATITPNKSHEISRRWLSSISVIMLSGFRLYRCHHGMHTGYLEVKRRKHPSRHESRRLSDKNVGIYVWYLESSFMFWLYLAPENVTLAFSGSFAERFQKFKTTLLLSRTEEESLEQKTRNRIALTHCGLLTTKP